MSQKDKALEEVDYFEIERLVTWLQNFEVIKNTILVTSINKLPKIKGSALIIDKSMASTKYFEQVKELKNYKGAIICCDRALYSVIQHRLPEYVMNVDVSPLCWSFFDRPDVKEWMPKINAVFPVTANPLTVRLWGGPRYFFTPWFGAISKTMAMQSQTLILPTGGQVASAAYILAYNLGAKTIGLFGINHCFDQLTEILTDNGWVTFDNLSQDMKVCTLNRQSNCIEFQLPTEIIKSDYTGKMIQIKSPHGLDLLVTPNHRFWVKKVSHGKISWGFAEASTLTHGHFLPCTGVWVGESPAYFILPQVDDSPALQIPMHLWVAFFGIWIAEGWALSRWKQRNNAYRVGISQNAGQKKREIHELLLKLPFHFIETRNDFVVTSKQLWTYFLQFGKAHTKYIPQNIKKLSPNLLGAFLDWLILGDGHRSPAHLGSDGRFRNQRRIFFSSSKRLVDDVQEIALKVGIHSRLIPHMSGFKPESQNYAVLFRSRAFMGIRPKKTGVTMNQNIFEAYYSGPVYCVKVPNQVIYVRRNGLPVWTGNSYDSMAESEYPLHQQYHECIEGRYGTCYQDPIYEHYNNEYLEFIRLAKEQGVTTINTSKAGLLYSDDVVDLSLEEFVKKYG